jgi:hypothetical protein
MYTVSNWGNLNGAGFAQAAASGAVAGAISVCPIPGLAPIIGGLGSSMVSGALGGGAGYFAGEGAKIPFTGVFSPSSAEAQAAIVGGAAGALLGQGASATWSGVKGGFNYRGFWPTFKSSFYTFTTDSIESVSVGGGVSAVTSGYANDQLLNFFESMGKYPNSANPYFLFGGYSNGYYNEYFDFEWWYDNYGY